MTEKRTLRIETAPNSSLKRIAWNGGGELPDALKGYFTSPAMAQRAIDLWYINNPRPAVVEEPDDPRDKVDPANLLVADPDNPSPPKPLGDERRRPGRPPISKKE